MVQGQTTIIVEVQAAPRQHLAFQQQVEVEVEAMREVTRLVVLEGQQVVEVVELRGEQVRTLAVLVQEIMVVMVEILQVIIGQEEVVEEQVQQAKTPQQAT